MGFPKIARAIGTSALAASLALSISPAAALASQLHTASPGTQASGKTTVYVVSSVAGQMTDYGNARTTRDKTVKYNANGMVSAISTTIPYGNGKLKTVDSFSYDAGSNLKKATTKTDGAVTGTITYALDKNGNFKKSVEKAKSGGSNVTTTVKYAYKSGKIAQLARAGSETTVVREYTYNKDKIRTYTSTYDSTYHPVYDKYGNISKNLLSYNGSGGSSLLTHSNTYKNKRLAKSAISTGVTYKYTYKAIKVDKGVAGKVKAQQWALLNNNLNLALGYYDIGGYFGDIR